MKKNMRRFVTGCLAGSLILAFGCERETIEQETVEAEEIAEGEGIADPQAEQEDLPEIEAELMLQGDEDLFDVIDLDSNQLVDRDEFEDMADRADIFGLFDVNEDRKLGEEEFYAVMFERWDDDQSGFVGPYEYLAGAVHWFGEDTEELENFADIDVNDDGLLSKNEFVGNMDDVALFDQWDLDDDADINPEELSSVLAQIWDVGADQNITRSEWGGQTPQTDAVVAGVAMVPQYIDDPMATWNSGSKAGKNAGKAGDETAQMGSESGSQAMEGKAGTRAQIGTTVSGTARVGKVVSDRGFWLVGNDSKVFAIVREDIPEKEMIDIDEGDELRLSGIVLDSEDVGLVGGKLDDETRKMISSQPAFVSIYHGQVEILDEG